MAHIQLCVVNMESEQCRFRKQIDEVLYDMIVDLVYENRNGTLKRFKLFYEDSKDIISALKILYTGFVNHPQYDGTFFEMLDLTDTNLNNRFMEVLTTTCAGQLHLGRLVSIISFTTSVSQTFVKEGKPNDVIESLIKWLTWFVIYRFETWILENGGLVRPKQLSPFVLSCGHVFLFNFRKKS